MRYSSLHFAAGGAVGALLGFTMGMSASPVVGTVLAALGAGLLALLGLKREGEAEREASVCAASSWRILGFGILAVAATLLGVAIRTHGWLSPSLAEQHRALTEAGFSDVEARQILWARENMPAEPASPLPAPEALRPADDRTTPAALHTDAGPPLASPHDSVLFAAAADDCSKLDAGQYRDMNAFLSSLGQRKGKYGQLAADLQRLDAADQKAAAAALRQFVCSP